MTDTPYTAAGVDTDREDAVLGRMAARLTATWPANGSLGAVQLPIGYFANVIDVGGVGLALTTDGVGSKILIAQMMNKYDTIGIDCVAMNVNDLLCVGARPLSMVDYIAVETLDPHLLEEITVGLCAGAREAGISIPGGETAQLRDVLRGLKPDGGFDLAGAAVGIVPLDRILVGRDIRAGDAIIGIGSNGIHSNGVTLAREALFRRSGFTVDTVLPELGHPLGEELLRPTSIYVREAMDLLDARVPVRAMIHHTSDGFLNLVRVDSDTGYVIESLPDPPPIFTIIQERRGITPEEMFRVFNMGIGFSVVVPPEDAERTLAIVQRHGKTAYRIGHTIRDPDRRVFIKPAGLVSREKLFVKESTGRSMR